MSILSVDFGFGYVKSIWKNEKIKIPSLISNYISNNNSLLDTTEITPIEMNGYSFLFGEDVINNGNKFKIYSRNIDYIIKFYPLAIQASINKLNIKNLNEIKELAIGLPPEDLNKKNATELKENIINSKINGKHFPWKKENIHIFAQGQGAFVYTKSNEKEIGNDGFLLDIGFNTLLAIPYKNKTILPTFKQYNRFGVSGILDEFLGPILKQKYDIKLNRNELDEAFKSGYIKKEFGKKINIEQDIKYSLEIYMQSIQTQIMEDFINEIPESEKFILVGGGSYRIKKVLNKSWKNNLIIIKEPEFANAKGYSILTKLKTLNG